MAINFRSNTVIKNLRVGPLSGGGNGGGGGGSSEPSYLAVGAQGMVSYAGAAYIYDATDYTATPTKLTAFDGLSSNYFGSSTAISNNHLVVGAYGNNNQTGAAYVYDVTNLSTTPTKLTESNTGPYGDQFGMSVAVSNDYLAIGAKEGAGSVYVYDPNNLSSASTRLSPSDISSGEAFGESVAISGNLIICGAPDHNSLDERAGAVYVYDGTNLSASPTKLTAFDGGYNHQFGEVLAASDNHLTVGVRYDNNGNNTSNGGAAYIYSLSNLSATPTKLIAPDSTANLLFGSGISVSNDYVIVGAPGDSTNGPDSGAVYVYDATNLSATPTKLTPSGLGDQDYFGKTVAVYGNQIVVGVYNDDDQGSNAGAAYVYDANNLSATPTKLVPTDLINNSRFGSSVSLG